MSNFIKMEYPWMNATITQFKQLYPNLIRRGISYEPYDKDFMVVRIPGVGKLLYDMYYDEINWLEHWEDKAKIKLREKERRSELYERFCFVIKRYLHDNHMTHQQFADMVGISRKSLSKYLNGDSIPKTSTMKRICETIDIDI